MEKSPIIEEAKAGDGFSSIGPASYELLKGFGLINTTGATSSYKTRKGKHSPARSTFSNFNLIYSKRNNTLRASHQSHVTNKSKQKSTDRGTDVNNEIDVFGDANKN